MFGRPVIAAAVGALPERIRDGVDGLVFPLRDARALAERVGADSRQAEVRLGKGRVAACEVLIPTPAVRNLIREGKTHQLASQIQTGREDGMVAFEASLFELLRTGRITREVALDAARDPVELQRRLREAHLS